MIAIDDDDVVFAQSAKRGDGNARARRRERRRVTRFDDARRRGRDARGGEGGDHRRGRAREMERLVDAFSTLAVPTTEANEGAEALETLDERQRECVEAALRGENAFVTGVGGRGRRGCCARFERRRRARGGGR